MQFANPVMLWGLLALVIPVIIHLFNFRRTKKVYFTNVAFLRKVETETSSFRTLRQWLVMLARMLFLACLVLAFAQPFLPAKNTESTAVNGMNSLYLDNSLSMQNTTQNKRYIDLAVLKIDELLSIFKNQQNVQFLSNSFSEEDQFINGAQKIKERLTEIDFSSQYRSIEQIYNRQLSLAQKAGSSGKNSYFWFSDFQKSTVGNLKTFAPDSNQYIYLVPVQGEAIKNVFVDSVWLASPFVREMQNAVLYVKVFNSGNEAVENLPIKLFLDGIQTSTSSVSVEAGTFATASFNFTVKERGEHKGVVRFDDQPLIFDNENFFVINISPPVRILHVFQEKSPNDYVAKLFADDSLFTFSQYSALNVNLNRFAENDFVILESISKLDDQLKNAVREFVANGGSVLLIPSNKPFVPSYNALLNALNAGMLRLESDSLSVEKQVLLNEPDTNNPFYADVFEQSAKNTLLNLPQVQTRIVWSGPGSQLLSVKSGKTFLSQSRFAKGFIYLLTAPLDSKYGNFAEHALFVPTLFKMAALSVRSQRLAYNFSEGVIRIPFANASKSAVYSLKNGETEMIPIQKVVGTDLILEMPDVSELGNEISSGFFDLLVDGKKEKTIAINHDSEESKMEQYSVEELQEIFAEKPNVTVFNNVLDGDFVSTFEANNFGRSLWKYFLYAALFFILLEILLVRFFHARPKI